MTSWPSLEDYLAVKSAMAADEWGREQIEWAENVTFPDKAEGLARDLIYVICNSGMKNTIARRIHDRIMAELPYTKRARDLPFGHPGKRQAIFNIWRRRRRLFREAKAAHQAGALVEWCGTVPWIGPITKFHAAKNLGANVAKPDIWLTRIAEAAGETVNGVCERLAGDSGDRIALVDLVLWWGCAYGHLHIPARAA